MVVTKKGLGWELMNSLWIILLFVPMIGGGVFIRLGIRADKDPWKLFGILYLAVSWGSVFYTAYQSDGTAGITVFVFAVSWLFPIVHGFLIRKEYLIRLEALKERGNTHVNRLRKDIRQQIGLDQERDAQ